MRFALRTCSRMITHPVPQRVWYVLFICRPAFVIIPLSVGPCRLSLQIYPFLNFLKVYVVCRFTYRSACLFTLYFWVVFLPQIFKCNCTKRHIAEVCFNCGQYVDFKTFCTSFWSWDVALLQLKKLFNFSRLFLLVFHCEWGWGWGFGFGCGCGCLMPFMLLWGCLRPAILVGFPRSHSFPLFCVRNYLSGHFLGSFLAIYWSCKVAHEGEGNPTSFVGLAPSPVRAELWDGMLKLKAWLRPDDASKDNWMQGPNGRFMSFFGLHLGK